MELGQRNCVHSGYSWSIFVHVRRRCVILADLLYAHARMGWPDTSYWRGLKSNNSCGGPGQPLSTASREASHHTHSTAILLRINLSFVSSFLPHTSLKWFFVHLLASGPKSSRRAKVEMEKVLRRSTAIAVVVICWSFSHTFSGFTLVLLGSLFQSIMSHEFLITQKSLLWEACYGKLLW